MRNSSSSGDRWRRLWNVFHRAAERPPSERAAYLDGVCGSEPDFRREVEELLAADDASRSPLDRSPREGPDIVTGPAIAGSEPVPAAVRVFAAGEVVARRFEIVRVLGQGGMGTVYEARDRELDTAVALKTLRPGLGGQDRAEERLRREINLARQVTHANVCRLFDIVRHFENHAGQAVERLFLSMELLKGETLAARLQREGRLAPAEVVPIVGQIADGLDAAHRAGIIHRDLKPANVMLVPMNENVRAVITDYGLARTLADDDQHLRDTRAGRLLGTPAYMAPEQLEDGPISAATDVYALGVLLYETLTGTLPFEGSTAIAAAVKRLRQPAPSPREILPDLDRRWESVIGRCLEMDPADRFPSARDAIAALEGDDAPGRLPWRWVPRRRLAWAGTALALVAAVVVLVAPHVLPPPDGEPVLPGMDSATAGAASILITRFDNRTGEALFDNSVEYALERELSRSKVVTVVPRERMGDTLRLMERPPDTPIDAALGREIALRDGDIAAVVRGRIEKLGSSYILGVDVVEPAGGRTIVSFTEEAPEQAAVLPAVRRLASSVRASLGEARSQIRAEPPGPLGGAPRVTTPSLRALQLFAQAEQAIADDASNVAEEMLRLAIVEDPGFASAHMQLAYAIRNQGRSQEEYLPFAERAHGLSEGTPPRERFFILGGYHSMLGEMEEAADAFEALVRLHPDHIWGVQNLADTLEGSLHRYAEAAPYRARASDLRPRHLAGAYAAATALRNDPTAARTYANRALALLEAGASASQEISGELETWIRMYDFHERWMQDDLDGAWAEFTRVQESMTDDPDSLWIMEGAAALLGRIGVVDQLLEMPFADPDDRLFFALLYGDQETAARLRETPLRDCFACIMMLDGAGFGDTARIRLAQVERGKIERNRPILEIIRGELALNEGKIEDAIEHLRPALPLAKTNWSGVYFLGSISLARALEQEGDLEAAAAVLENARRQKGWVYAGEKGALWLRCLSRLLDLNRAMGRDRAAAELEVELRTLLRLADPDHPILARLPGSTRS